MLRARKNSVAGYGPIILGIDPSRKGKDKTGFVDRQGRRIGQYVCERVDYGENTMAIAAHAVRLAKQLKPKGLKKICIDTTGLGGPIYDRLVELLPIELLEPVGFGDGANDAVKYGNRRAEMWDLKREWYLDPAGVQVPDSDEFQGDETSISWGKGHEATRHRSNGQLILESKEHIAARLGFSPDLGDAAALTFAPDMSMLYAGKPKQQSRSGGGSAWAA